MPASAMIGFLCVPALVLGLFLSVAGILPAGAAGETHTHDAAAAAPAEPLKGQNKPAVEDRDERLRAGQERLAAHDLYVARCAECHGRDGVGKGSVPVDFTIPEAVADLSRARMIDAVGAKHDAIVGAGLAADEIASIVDYVQDALMIAAPSADPSAGRSIYARTCSVCHGDRGNSASWARNALDPPPYDFTSAKARTELTRTRMINSVTYGVLGTAMMPFTTQLTREEIAATVDYIRQTFIFADGAETAAGAGGHAGQQGGAHAGHGGDGGPVDMDAPFPAGLVGDVAAGKVFFDANCAECHGRKGDGQGRRAYFMMKKPANFLSPGAQASLNRPHLLQSIAKGVVGTTMPAWSKVLTPQQMVNVGEYVFVTFIRPELAASAPAPGWKPAGTVEPVKKN